MKKLRFDYYMQIDYSKEVSKCNFTIKCLPKDNFRQKIENVEISLFPTILYNEGIDGFGNAQIYGVNDMPHKTFSYRITGDATVGLCDCEEEENDNQTMIFFHPYGNNVAGDKIKAYYQQISTEIEKESGILDPTKSPVAYAKQVMHCLHRDFTYKALSTDIYTTAEEAFSLGCGVCQDFSHIMISLLHLAHIGARYVTGLIVGEGASHAWTEVYENGKWYGLDPTNDKMIFDEQIKLGVGRDAHDCMINRGIMHGGGLHTQTIKVNVKEME